MRDPAADSVELMNARPGRPTREVGNWRNAVFAIFFLSGLSIASWVARLPELRDANGLSTQTLGLVILTGSIGSVVGLVLAPWLLARLGARRSMIITLTSVAIGLAFVGIGGSAVPVVGIVITGLVFWGVGQGSVDVIMNVEGADAERAIGRTVMPLMHAFFSFGTVAGAGVAAAASALSISVTMHLGTTAVLVVGGVLIAVRYLPMRAELGDTASLELPKRPLGERVRENFAVWKDPSLLLIGLVMLGMSFAEGSANDWLAIAAVDGHGFDATTGALIFGVFTVSMTVSRVAGGPIVDRFGRVPMLRLLAVVGIVGLSLFIFGTELWVIVLGVVLWGVGAALGFPIGISAAADDPKHAAARVSAVSMIGYAAFLVGPPLLGLLGEQFGILNALLVILALMVLAGLAAPAARERTHTSAAGPSPRGDATPGNSPSI